MYLTEDYIEFEWIGYVVRLWTQEDQPGIFGAYFYKIPNLSKTVKELATEMMDQFPQINAIQISYKGSSKVLYRDWP